MTQQPSSATPMPEYADGTWTHVLEATRRGTLEQIVVHQGLPMGPRGVRGPTGPTGAKGESTEWTVGRGDPPPATIEDEIGDLYVDLNTGDVYELGRMGWTKKGNLLGPTGPTGPVGAPANIAIGTVLPGDPGEAAVFISGIPPDYTLSFVVPAGPTGPAGPPPEMVTGLVVTQPGGVGADVVLSHGSNGVYTVDWYLEPGPTGPAGTNIRIVGELPDNGPPSATNPPSGAAANPVDGDGWVGQNDHVWTWAVPTNQWIDVGPIIGAVGPTGATGPGYRVVEYDIALRLVGDQAVQDIYHSLPHPFPVTRVLLEDPLVQGVFTDAQTAHVTYMPPNQVHVVMDGSFLNVVGKIVLT